MTAAATAGSGRRAARLLMAAAIMFGAVMSADPAAAHPLLLHTTPATDETVQAAGSATVVLVLGEPVTAGLPHAVPVGAYTGAGGDPSWPTTVLRFVLLAGISLAVGGVVAEAMARRARTINPALPAVEGWTGVAAVAGAAAAAGLALRLPLESSTVDTTAAQIAAVQAATFGVIVVAQAVRRAKVSIAALMVIVAAEAIGAHPNIAWPGWGSLLTFIHVAAAGTWVGTLIHVLRVAKTWRPHPDGVRWLVFAYARIGLWLFAVVVLTGAVSGLLLVPASTILTTMYGRLLLAKVGLVAAALVFALAARRRLTSDTADVDTSLRLARMEAAVLAVVIALTATLTATPPPAGTNARQLPPAPAGLVPPAGTLAGRVGVHTGQPHLPAGLATPRWCSENPGRRRPVQLTPDDRHQVVEGVRLT